MRQLERAKIGILCREKRGRESYYRLEHNSAPSLSVNPEAIEQLALCRDLIAHLLPESVQDETAMTLASLGGRANTGYAIRAGSLLKGRIDMSRFSQILMNLEKAIREKRVCRVSYQAANNCEPRSHLFAPQRLLASIETIYVEGWLLKDNEPYERKYKDPLRLALQRFKSCEFTGISPEGLPGLPSLKTDSFGLVEDDPFEARIWFAPGVAAYISERVWSKGQSIEKDANGGVILNIKLANLQEGLAWIMGFGKNAVVREPDWLAEAVRREMRQAVRNYRKKKVSDKQEQRVSGYKKTNADQAGGKEEGTENP